MFASPRLTSIAPGPPEHHPREWQHLLARCRFRQFVLSAHGGGLGDGILLNIYMNIQQHNNIRSWRMFARILFAARNN
jgi:hypothetical protein